MVVIIDDGDAIDGVRTASTDLTIVPRRFCLCVGTLQERHIGTH